MLNHLNQCLNKVVMRDVWRFRTDPKARKSHSQNTVAVEVIDQSFEVLWSTRKAMNHYNQGARLRNVQRFDVSIATFECGDAVLHK